MARFEIHLASEIIARRLIARVTWAAVAELNGRLQWLVGGAAPSKKGASHSRPLTAMKRDWL